MKGRRLVLNVVNDNPRVEKVVGCARCGGDHESLRFEPFTNPIEVDEKRFAWWAPCPSTGQPILLAVYDLSEGETG